MHRMILSLVVLLGLSACAASGISRVADKPASVSVMLASAGSAPQASATFAPESTVEGCPDGVTFTVVKPNGQTENWAWQPCPASYSFPVKRDYNGTTITSPSIEGLQVGWLYSGNAKEMGLALGPVLQGKEASALVKEVKYNHGYSYIGRAALSKVRTFEYTLSEGITAPATEFKFVRITEDGTKYDHRAVYIGPLVVHTPTQDRLIFFPVECQMINMNTVGLDWKALPGTIKIPGLILATQNRFVSLPTSK